jgi:hypothetical protein
MLMYFTSVNDPKADDLELQVLADKKDRSGRASDVHGLASSHGPGQAGPN